MKRHVKLKETIKKIERDVTLDNITDIREIAIGEKIELDTHYPIWYPCSNKSVGLDIYEVIP